MMAAGWDAEETAHDIGRLARRMLVQNSVPGLSLALIRDGEAAWQVCFGLRDAASGVPVERDTIFEAASLSKPIFSYAVLDLADRGLIDLDAPLDDYLGAPIVENDQRSGRITARMVLSHSTGLQNWLWADGERPELSFDPGTDFSYSSLGFVYLQRAAERVTGLSLDAIVGASVFGPLGMRTSSYSWRPEYEALAATPHDATGQPKPKWRPDAPLACASLHATPSDYARFVAASLGASSAGPLRAAIVERQLVPTTSAGESVDWGLGWGLERTPQDRFFWHWGDNGAFKAFVIGSIAERSALVTMTNGERGLVVCERLVRAVFGDDHPCFGWLAGFYAR